VEDVREKVGVREDNGGALEGADQRFLVVEIPLDDFDTIGSEGFGGCP